MTTEPGPAAEPAGVTFGRISALADFAMSPACHYCSPEIEIAATGSESMPIAVGVTHEPYCPDFAPDWP